MDPKYEIPIITKDGGQVALDEVIAPGGTTRVTGPWIDLLTTWGRPGLQLTTTDDLQGTWHVEASNHPAVVDTRLISPPRPDVQDDPTPADITAAFVRPGGTAIAAVVGASSQAAQAAPWDGSGGDARVGFRLIRVAFVPTSGGGRVLARLPYVSPGTRVMHADLVALGIRHGR